MEDGNTLMEHIATLRAPSASMDSVYHSIHELGRARYYPARRDIERLLTNEDPELRWVALEVLTRHLQLLEHLQAAMEFLKSEPDEDNRMRGALGILDLLRGTGDADGLRALARVVRDPNEDIHVRQASYRAMRGIFRYDPAEQSELSRRDLNFDTDIDWGFVDAYAGTGGAMPQAKVDEHEQSHCDGPAGCQAMSGRHAQWPAPLSRLATIRAALRDGTIPDDRLQQALHEIADSRYTEAEQEVAQYLRHPDPEIRRMALQALTLHFHLLKYWPQAVDFLEHDADLDCRVQGALSMMYLVQDTSDVTSLVILAHVVSDQREDPGVRRAAYRAMLGIVNFEPRQQMALASRDFNPEVDVDWALVNAYSADTTTEMALSPAQLAPEDGMPEG